MLLNLFVKVTVGQISLGITGLREKSVVLNIININTKILWMIKIMTIISFNWLPQN